MNIEKLREYCLFKKGVTECFPFDETTLVFKVGEKIFCMTDLEGDFSVNLKNDPEKNLELREHYPAVKPGWHMNKRHWNTVDLSGYLSDALVYQLIDESYEIVVKGMSRKEKEALNKI
ncbi:MAG TPA: MmcQ/YjbR family DNA-binding protein [Mariniphaga sp.]|nr:MmcQ/YjbR family DNA-binding protein [Mariniphaga sp.]